MVEIVEDDPQNYNFALKFIIIGDISVGKTSIIYNFSTGVAPDNLHATLGMDFCSKNVSLDNARFHLEFWDCSGDKNYLSLTRSYCNGCICALIVYDISKKKTFDNVNNWITQFRSYCTKNEKVLMVLVGNKCDLPKREVEIDEAKNLANKYRIKYYETSAFTGQNIHQMFDDIVRRIARKIDKGYYDLKDQDYGIRLNKIVQGNNGKILENDEDDDSYEGNDEDKDNDKDERNSGSCKCVIY